MEERNPADNAAPPVGAEDSEEATELGSRSPRGFGGIA